MLKTIAGSHPKGGFERVQPEWTWVGRGEKEQWKEEREIYEWETRWKRMAKERGREKAKEKEKKGRKGEVVSPLTCLTKRPGNILLHEVRDYQVEGIASADCFSYFIPRSAETRWMPCLVIWSSRAGRRQRS